MRQVRMIFHPHANILAAHVASSNVFYKGEIYLNQKKKHYVGCNFSRVGSDSVIHFLFKYNRSRSLTALSCGPETPRCKHTRTAVVTLDLPYFLRRVAPRARSPKALRVPPTERTVDLCCESASQHDVYRGKNHNDCMYHELL